MGDLFSVPHLLLLLGIVFLLFGGRKLPELGKGLGEGLKGFKDAVKGAETPVTTDASAVKSDAHTVTPQPEQPIQPK